MATQICPAIKPPVHRITLEGYSDGARDVVPVELSANTIHDTIEVKLGEQSVFLKAQTLLRAVYTLTPDPKIKILP